MAFLKTKRSLGLIGSFNAKHDASSSSLYEKKDDVPEVHKSQETNTDYSISDEIIIPRKSKSASSDISVSSAKFSLASSFKSNWSRISKKFRFSHDSDKKSDWKTRSLYIFKKNKSLATQDVISNVIIELKYPYRSSILTFKSEYSKEYRNSFRLCVEQQSALQQMTEDFDYYSIQILDALDVLKNMPRTMENHAIIDKLVVKIEEILQKLEDLKAPLDSQPISYADLSPLNIAGVIVEYQKNVFGPNGFLNQLFTMNNILCNFVDLHQKLLSPINVLIKFRFCLYVRNIYFISKRILCSYSQCTQEHRVEVGELRSAISKLQSPIQSLYNFHGKNVKDNFPELEKLEINLDTTKCRTIFPEKHEEDINLKNSVILIFLTVPYDNYRCEILNCAKMYSIFKCVEVSFRKKIKYSNTNLSIYLLEDTIIITERLSAKGKEDQRKLLMPPVPLIHASIQGLAIGATEILQITLNSSCVLTVASKAHKDQEQFHSKFTALQEKMLINLENSSPKALVESKYPVNDKKSSLNTGLLVQTLNDSTVNAEEESKTKILYMQCTAYKLNDQKQWGSLGKTEVQVFKAAQKYWIEFYNPDTKRSIFSSQIHVGTVAKLEGNFVRLIFPMKPDSALFGVKASSGIDAERLFQIIKRAVRAQSRCIVDNSKVLVLDSKRISWSHLKYKEIRSSLDKYIEMFIPEYQDIVKEIAVWNHRLDNPSLSSHSMGDFTAAFTNNDSTFLGPVQATLYDYGIGDEKTGHGELLASKIVIRSCNNPIVIYLSCGLERLEIFRTKQPNVINLRIDSGADYSLSCKDLDHCNSLFEFLESCIQKAQMFQEKYSQIISKHSDRSALLETWKIKAKEIEKEEFSAQEAAQEAAKAAAQPIAEILKQEPDQDSVKETDQDLVKETDQDVVKEPDQDSVKETDQDLVKETDQDSVKETDQDVVKQESDLKMNVNTGEKSQEISADSGVQVSSDYNIPEETPIIDNITSKPDQSLSKGISDLTLQDESPSVETRRQQLVSLMGKKALNASKSQLKLEQYQQKLLDNRVLLRSAQEETKKLKDEFVDLILENASLKQEIYSKS